MADVTLKCITKKFDDTVAVNTVSAYIHDGEFVTLLGPSGCGKTTTLRMIAGFIEPSSGTITVGSRVVSSPEEGIFVPPEDRQIGMVFQSYAVWPHLNILDNVAYPLKIRKVPRDERYRRAEEILELVRLGGLGKRFPNQLSGGQQQRVALARALIMRPQVMLLDEPLSNLDAKLREEMRFELKDLQRETGVTIIYVTHDQAEAMAMSDRIIVMEGGTVHQIGAPVDIYRRPANRFVADFIGLTNFVPCEVVPGGVRLSGEDGTTIPVPVPGGLKGSAVLSIRPEDIVLAKDASGNLEKPGVRGVVERRTYLGNFVDYQVRVGQNVLRVQSDSRSSYEPGQAVVLQFGHATVFAMEVA